MLEPAVSQTVFSSHATMGQLSLDDGDVGLVVEETKRRQRLTRLFGVHPRFPHAERGVYYTLRFRARTVLRRTLLFAV